MLFEKTAIVTGAASGIGYAVAQALRQEGAQVVMADVNEALLIESARKLGGVPFVVSYVSSEITVTAEAPVGNVTVTNRLNYAELPRTGGSGTAGFTALGILLIAASLTLFAVKRRREPRS